MSPHSVTAGTRPPRFALVAGEASGDLLGAGLINELRARYPDAEFAGVAGPLMRAAGMLPWYDCSELSVMGLAEVLRHLPRLLRLRRALRRQIEAWQPDVFIGIDAPDFNLGLERRLRERGIRTVHYVSPSVWAWREQRASKIGESADRVLCLFPMEPPIYARYDVQARFVGHPLAEAFPLDPNRHVAREQLGDVDGAPVLAVLPGSRLGEIRRLGADFVRAAALLRRRHPRLFVLAPMANPRCSAAFAEAVQRCVAQAPVTGTDETPSRSELGALQAVLRIVDGQSHRVMIAADLILLASGTAALEGMLAKRPMVVGYRIAPLTHFIVRRLGMLKVDRYSLPNVLAGETVVPELMQEDCTPRRLAAALDDWLHRPQAMTALEPRFRALHQQLQQGASARAADAIDELVARPQPQHAL